ncbi:translation initiation factor IF-1 [Phreatobacter sp.]|uniref:translation initiation factor IF-1 n=1 Tax=Phreatobacter sp. TaxID=1966341 RepID=UPI003F70AC5B
MAKEDVLNFEGKVIEVMPDARFRVELDNGHLVVVYTAGKMKKNRIKTLVGDRVTVEMTPYDLDKGRLVFRHKGDSPPPGMRPGGARPGGPPRRR